MAIDSNTPRWLVMPIASEGQWDNEEKTEFQQEGITKRIFKKIYNGNFFAVNVMFSGIPMNGNKKGKPYNESEISDFIDNRTSFANGKPLKSDNELIQAGWELN